MTGCGQNSKNSEPFIPEVIGTYEAEDADFTGNVSLGRGRTGYTGQGFATGFTSDQDKVTFQVPVEQEGFYDLIFRVASDDYKENYVKVDGVLVDNIVSESRSFTDCPITNIYLEVGNHEIEVSGFWSYFDLDSLTVVTSEPVGDVYQVPAKLSDANATEETKRLYSYLLDNYGKNVLSGQVSDGGLYGQEMVAIERSVGDKPAILGLDFMNYSPTFAEGGAVGISTDKAIEFWNAGGIVTFCWHWGAPSKYTTGIWYKTFYKDSTSIDLAKIMNGEDEEGYELLIRDIGVIAEQLKILQDAGVPVIWRPLHEASGGWFWWGAKGPEAYIALYKLVYTELTETHGIHNLIWLWNGQNPDWYPGDEYVDMIGYDIYPGKHQYGSQVGTFTKATKISEEGKMVVLSENGCVPNPALITRDNAYWGYWCTWCGEFCVKGNNLFQISDEYTEESKLQEFYANDIVITLKELPDLKTYKIRKGL